jgi:hypothetical protein
MVELHEGVKADQSGNPKEEKGKRTEGNIGKRDDEHHKLHQGAYAKKVQGRVDLELELLQSN